MLRQFRINARLPSPKVPTSRTDPVRAAPLLNKAFTSINARYRGIRQEVNNLFNAIPVRQGNADASNYTYDFNAQRAAQLSEQLQGILDKWLLDGYEINRFWMGVTVEDSYRQGTMAAQSNLASMSATYSTERSLSVILFSQPYQTRVGIAYASSYSDWKGLSDSSRADLAGIISEGIAAGANPKSVVTDIATRLDVSRSRARAISQTEITGALRQARRDEADETKALLGLEIVLLWTSALIPTTRAWHSSRHGRTYSTDEVADFYSRNGNRYRCLCAQTEALVINGKPSISDKLKEEYAKEKATWDKSNGEQS